LGDKSKLGGTRRSSGKEDTGRKGFTERKDHMERLIEKTNGED
jgi:hypothetical protein